MLLERMFDYALFPYRTWMINMRCIFIHIPKTAGTSILRALGAPERPRVHLPWYVYYIANEGRFAKYFKFAFVRNPWDRAYSAYNYLAQGGNQTTDIEVSEWITNNFPDFEAFLEHGLGSGIARSNHLFIPQSNYIVDYKGGLKVDCLGRVESIDKDFIEIKSRLHLVTSLERINVSETDRCAYRSAYRNPQSVEIISEIYAQDIRLFNYSF